VFIVDIEVKVDSSSVDAKLNRIDSKVENLGPLLDSIADTLILHYQSIMEPASASGSGGRAYLYGGLKASVGVIAMNDHMVGVGPSVNYAESAAAGVATPPVRKLKPQTKGYPEYAFNEGGAKDAALKLITQFYETLLD
jgi:hypothetical protein